MRREGVAMTSIALALIVAIPLLVGFGIVADELSDTNTRTKRTAQIAEDKATQATRIAENKAQDVARAALVAQCKRSRSNQLADQGQDRDIRGIMRAAAAARRAEGDFRVARRYDQIAERADKRIKGRAPRIVNCEQAFPSRR